MSISARWKVLAALIVALMVAGIGSSTTVQAQDATPTAVECVAPELPPGTPTPMEDMEGMDMASPEAGDMGMDMATPMAEEEAPSEEPVGTPAEGAVADEIVAAVTNIANCINSGDLLGAAALLTPDALMSEFGLTNPYDVPMAMEGFSLGEFQVSNPKTYEDGSVSADIQYMGSQFQIVGETWHLVDDGGTWKLNSFSTVTPSFEGDATVVGVALTESENDDGTRTYAFVPNVASIPQPEVLVLHGINNGVELHEMVVVQLPEGADAAGILDGSVAEEDVMFVGYVEIAPGEEVDMVLQGLQPGVYHIVCFYPGPDGTPHAFNGMITQIEITAPAA